MQHGCDRIMVPQDAADLIYIRRDTYVIEFI